MAGEGEEVDVEVDHIHGYMGRALGTVADEDCPDSMGFRGKGLDVIEPAEDIRHLGHGNKSRLFGKQLLKFVQRKLPVFPALEVGEDGPGLFRQNLPGKKVAVVLGDGDDDFISLVNEGLPVGISDEVQGLRRIPRKDDFRRLRRPDKIRDRFPGFLVLLRGPDADIIEPPHGVGIHGPVEFFHCVQHRLGPLGCGGIIEIYEFFIGENREMRPNLAVFIRHSAFFLCQVQTRNFCPGNVYI